MAAWETDPFYWSSPWRNIRSEILNLDKNECQICKKKGGYSRAVIVHHVKHRKDFPELELEKYYIDENGKEQRNLISVCQSCHETVCHPERLTKFKTPTVPERW